jgi:hypothetical protein
MSRLLRSDAGLKYAVDELLRAPLPIEENIQPEIDQYLSIQNWWNLTNAQYITTNEVSVVRKLEG